MKHEITVVANDGKKDIISLNHLVAETYEELVEQLDSFVEKRGKTNMRFTLKDEDGYKLYDGLYFVDKEIDSAKDLKEYFAGNRYKPFKDILKELADDSALTEQTEDVFMMGSYDIPVDYSYTEDYPLTEEGEKEFAELLKTPAIVYRRNKGRGKAYLIKLDDNFEGRDMSEELERFLWASAGYVSSGLFNKWFVEKPE